MQTSDKTTAAVQDVHTATNDVLAGYREMASRARPEIQPVIQRLVQMHERHAAEHARLLADRPDATVGDTSLQATVNKAVVVLRDWVSDLDRDTLPAVRQGEQALRERFAKALAEPALAADPSASTLLTAQAAELDLQVAGLPRD